MSLLLTVVKYETYLLYSKLWSSEINEIFTKYYNYNGNITFLESPFYWNINMCMLIKYKFNEY